MGGGCLQELVFRSVFDSCSSFFALKLHGNISYTGYLRSYWWTPSNYKGWISDPFSLEGDCGIHCSFLCGPFVFEGCLKYKLFSVAKK